MVRRAMRPQQMESALELELLAKDLERVRRLAEVVALHSGLAQGQERVLRRVQVPERVEEKRLVQRGPTTRLNLG
jgi:hypothetical protein